MAPDVSGPSRNADEDAVREPPGNGLPERPELPDRPDLPDRRAPGDPEPRGREPETLPELRAEEVSGVVDRPRRGGPPMPPSTYAPRFRALTGALVGLGIGAAMLIVVALFAPGFSAGPPWSPWKPSAEGMAGADQIARHVGPAYHLSTGGRLVNVRGGPVRDDLLGTRAEVAVAHASELQSGMLVRGSSVMFQLCGTGPSCRIAGTPSRERFLLVRREALELALYSLRYLKGVDNVVAILPPTVKSAPGGRTPQLSAKPQRTALFFQRSQLQPALDRPLRSILPSPAPTVSSIGVAPEAALVRQLTDHNVFTYTFVQDGRNLSPVLLLVKPDGG